MSSFDRIAANIGITALAMAAGTVGMAFGGPLASGLAYSATLAIGGAIVANNMAPPTPEPPNESPTYSWNVDSNTAKEGDALFVTYGEEQIAPRVINQWLEIDNDTGTQTMHNLYCCSIGTTNIEPTLNDISIGDQPLTILPSADYTLETTDGSKSQSILTNHEYLHQMRRVGRELKEAKLSQILLHFDGGNNSTQIIEDGVGVADDPDVVGDTPLLNKWTCHNGAKLTTAHATETFSGISNLNIEIDEDYISCDTEQAFNIWERGEWDIEFRFRQDVLTDSGIIGQRRDQAVGPIYYIWGLFYYDSEIVFQQYKWDGVDHTVYFNVAVPVSLSVDTWHHIRVARESTFTWNGQGELTDLYSSTISVFVDGVLIDSGTNETDDPVYPDAGTWTQTIGKATYYTGVGRVDVYGNCELDEFRLFSYGHLYDLEAFTPPTNPLSDDGEQTFFTKGIVDSFSVILSCPQGLYKITDAGAYVTTYVRVWISYRKIGSSDWYRKYELISGDTIQPLYQQRDYTMPERGKYEIRVSNLQVWNRDEYINPHDPKRQRTLYLNYVDERLHVGLTYPYHQLLSLSVVAQDKYNTKMDVVKVVNKRTNIEVPNYNGVGTRWCYPKNNSQAAFDMLTNTVYGGAKDPTSINETEWGFWNVWCYGPVRGNARCSVNTVFDRQTTLREALQEVESGGRAEIITRGMQYGVVINMPAYPTGLFVPQNIIAQNDGAVIQSNPVLPKKDRADKVTIMYRDKDKDYTLQPASAVCSDYYTMTRKAKVVRISMQTINSFQEAKRMATLLVQQNESALRASTLQTNMVGMRVAKGDVYIHIPARVRSFSGRLGYGSSWENHYTFTAVYLDREITLDSTTFGSSCTMYVEDPNGTIQTHTVTGPFDEATKSVTVSESATFSIYSVWAIVPTGTECLYRAEHPVFNMNKHVRIEGIQYDSTTYYNWWLGGWDAI